jgi:hypothetical protein
MELIEWMPALKNPEEDLATLAQWNKALAELSEKMGYEWPGAAIMVTASRHALQHVAEKRGMSTERVEKELPATVIIGIYMRDQVLMRAHRMAAYTALPYPQAAPMLHRWAREAEQQVEDQNLVTVLLHLMPQTSIKGIEVAAGRDRRNAALMAVEALRMHAAETGGLPEKLEGVTVVPVPPDPMTGRAFFYELEDGTATLRHPDWQQNPDTEPVHFTLRLEEE